MYLAIDIGTSSFKAALGNGMKHWVEQIPLHLTQSGVRAEQDPQEWIQAISIVIPKLLKRSSLKAKQIRGISVSSHSPSLVPVDCEGRPLFPCLTWRDRRAIDQSERLTKLIHEFVDPSFFEPKILWIKGNESEVYAQTHCFLQPKDFVIYHLTGEMVIDRAAARFSRADKLADIDQTKLPREVNNWEVVSYTSTSARELGLAPGIPVVAGGIDAYCEALGAGLVDDGQVGEVTGTSTCLSYCLHESREVDGAASHVIPRRSLCIMPMSAGGGTLGWFLNTFGGGLKFADVAGVVSQSPPGAKGLIFLPYLSGERSPIWDEHAKGVFFGITSAHTIADFLRAVLEGTAFAVRHNYESLAGRGLTSQEVRATGGGARLRVWNQIKADITGLDYHQLDMTEGALLGGLLLAAYAVEKISIRELVKQNVRIKETFRPKESVAVYDELYEKYKKLYDSTKELMR